jgi:rhodanese-related sulfurtransferase
LRSPVLQAVVLAALGAALGIVGNTARTDGIALVGHWPDATTPPCSTYALIAPPDAPPCLTLDDVVQVHGQSGVVFLDGRESVDYDDGHIRGAVSLPFYEAADVFPRVRETLQAAEYIIVYCEGKDCEVALFIATDLSEAGYDSVAVYAGGYDEWAAAGFPTDRMEEES